MSVPVMPSDPSLPDLSYSTRKTDTPSRKVANTVSDRPDIVLAISPLITQVLKLEAYASIFPDLSYIKHFLHHSLYEQRSLYSGATI